MSQPDLMVTAKLVALVWCFGAYLLALAVAFRPSRAQLQAHAAAILEDPQ